MTQLISIGPPTQMLQNVVYALSVISVILHSDVIIQTSLLPNGPWTDLSSTDRVVSGVFARCIIGNATVTFKRNIAYVSP